MKCRLLIGEYERWVLIDRLECWHLIGQFITDIGVVTGSSREQCFIPSRISFRVVLGGSMPENMEISC